MSEAGPPNGANPGGKMPGPPSGCIGPKGSVMPGRGAAITGKAGKRSFIPLTRPVAGPLAGERRSRRAAAFAVMAQLTIITANNWMKSKLLVNYPKNLN